MVGIHPEHTSFGPSAASDVPVVGPISSGLPSSTLHLTLTALLALHDPERVSTPPTTSDEHDTAFYDALDNLFELDEPDSRQPALTAQHASCPKDIPGSTAGATPGPASELERFSNTSAPTAPSRGVSVPAASLTTPPAIPCLAERVKRDFPPHTPADGSASRGPVKKAVVVGMNYAGRQGVQQLKYGIRDAMRFGSDLKDRGFPEENIIVLTDEASQEDQKSPTSSVLMSWVGWLLLDAKAGDTLVFFFSGHGFKCNTFAGLIMADGLPFDRDQLHKHLVSPVPAGCELHIMLDCCYASAMIQLQYCIGRIMIMTAEPSFVEPTTVSASAPELAPPVSDVSTSVGPSLTQPVAPVPLQREALTSSLHGLPHAHDAGATATTTLPSSSPPANNTALPRAVRGRATLATAPPPTPSTNDTASTRTGWSGYLTSLVMGQAPVNSSAAAPQMPTCTGGEPKRARQAVVKADRLPDYFEERKEKFVKPAGYVFFWAGAGEEQLAYEAYSRLRVWNGAKVRVENGIVTHALCTALDARINQILTVRDAWYFLVDTISKENRRRSKRDAKKSVRPDPKERVQEPELWVSQPEPLRYAAPALDRPMF